MRNLLRLFLLSATAGQLADKFDKARLTRLVKLNEIGIVLLAAAGFGMHSLIVLMTALFLLGVNSALFGPIKYAILPQHLRVTELVGGNALIEAGTFVAILLGTLLGGVLAASGNGGIITGAALMLSARLSAGRVRLGLVYSGAIGLTLFALDLACASPGPSARAALLNANALLATPGFWRIGTDLILLGACGGLFSVPLYTLTQQRSSDDCRARIIGANNALNALFMVFGALAAAALQACGMTLPMLFGVAALCSAAVTACICRGLHVAPHLSADLTRHETG
ncbi:MAG: hypothetical protein WC100_04630 [Sterolibacterium sp.]